MLEITNNGPFYHFHWSYENFTNLSNPITHLTLSSFKNIQEKNVKPFNFIISFANPFFFHIQLHVYLQLKFIVAIQVA